ncbi:hypothetical protein PIB30_079116 [Stylosanthes scabra]|uniref:Fanconi anemia group M protein n=1 Tax=Stylosanthes scabra TaxID=79078 RepID=A0ABU6QR50_9FABA|nr:hypothetical protein [Stylosanthes scabra]
MTSNNPYEIIDDDDDEVWIWNSTGFDWEAAAREIDVVCQQNKVGSGSGCDAKGKAKAKGNSGDSSRQSTLDEFVVTAKKEAPVLQAQHEEEEEVPASASIHPIDAEAAKTWIYPVNVPLRDYQFAITQSALFSNTLVALPTGLGKTLIAAVVMYNYFRWFPQGKIVFAAPSRPLVMQQIEACHNIVGIPQKWTIDMTGQISPPKRACFWKTKRVFFVTPQVLEKDIHSGICSVKYFVCLVIDEAHRATGNYSYCEAVRELMAVPVQLRILALTATPGSKKQTVQHVIDNLHISKLEYRSEINHDVVPYVHNRQIELIEVPMGQDAEEINEKLLEVIRPIVARLNAIGVIQNRNYRTLSPCALLEIREKFRQGHRQDLSNVDVEGYFGVLITLYYIHKLLSSHGVRPAQEMLERKLKQGFFAKFMSKNEVILKARRLMQQSLSHGASSPKLFKMLEVLQDHFKTNDPKSSRVIIFSNYRESVRDIMGALGNIGDPVRATEFIGQSSGKAMKGQSQKVQQAVLKKFRSGAYNVIVATSIGEEGLDIMEVDLVISFDANISPLRMIQRMGRTGRKHDGRVDILWLPVLCIGLLTMRKAIDVDGDIPHVFKPEVQYVELSIEKYIPREKNVKDVPLLFYPSIDRLTVAEMDLLEMYFQTTGENKCRLSLIAYPYFQTFPSRVHKVKHSLRTMMLIDTMQHLQGLETCPGDNKTTSLQEGPCLGNSKPFIISEAKHDTESCFRDTMERNVDTVNCMNSDSHGLGIQTKDTIDLTIQEDSTFDDLVEHQEDTFQGDEIVPETPDANKNVSNGGDNADATANLLVETPLFPEDVCINGIREGELSPRLSNFITSGVVPESPVDDEQEKSRGKSVIRDCILPVQLHKEQDTSPLSCEKVVIDGSTGKNFTSSPVYNGTRTPLLELKNSAIKRRRIIISQTVEGHSHKSDSSFSEESHLGSGKIPGTISIKPLRKFKRLRKAEDDDSKVNQENNDPTRYKHGQGHSGKRKSTNNVKDFIEEEAEVSGESNVSSDIDGEDDNSYEDSFIDDRTNPIGESQPEVSRLDMMAIYRRSLLTQTQINGGYGSSSMFSPDSVTNESGVSSGKTVMSHVNGSCIAPEKVLSTSSPTGNSTSHKRRLSFYHSEGHLPIMNLEQQFALQSKKELVDAPDFTVDYECDDQFYNDLDLDELEAQAISLHKKKLDISTQKQDTNPLPHSPKEDSFWCPSFDLGI